MKPNIINKIILVAMGCLAQFCLLNAKETTTPSHVEFGIDYSTELQTNFKRAKWVNLLRMDLSVKLARGLALNAATLSTEQTNEERLIDDLQGFSNIEAENIPLTLAVFSLGWETENTTLEVGIRNFNENYFATELSSFFTQSSHGISPTIAFNFPIANFPVASLGVDFQWRIKQLTLDASLYNGIGYKNFTGRENLFRFCPKSDGVFGAVQLSHEAAYGNSHLGIAMRSDCERTRAAFWAYTELNIAANTQLLAEYSFAPKPSTENTACKQHASLGVKQTIGKVELGLAENFARFAETDEATSSLCNTNEWATELSARLPIMKRAALQPVLHLCRTDRETHCVALLRFNYTF